MIRCPKCSLQMLSFRSFGGHAGRCRLTPAELFWFKVAKGDGCWLWQGRRDALGYGRFDRKGPLVFAHRCAWIFTNGSIADGLDVCHTCDVRRCCNPSHMFLGTHDENMADAKAKGRNAWGERSKNNKLTLSQVIEIRGAYKYERAARGTPRIVRSNSKVLAAQYGVGISTISKIGLRQGWTGIDGESK